MTSLTNLISTLVKFTTLSTNRTNFRAKLATLFTKLATVIAKL